MRPLVWLHRTDGFSVADIAATLSVMAVLSGAAAPAVNDYVEEAKQIRARHDVAVLAAVLVRLFNDTGSTAERDGGWRRYDVLVGAGQVPTTSGRDAEAWALSAGERVGLLDDHLVRNAPSYPVYVPRAAAGWRGAYLDETVQSDPWGHRFALNVAAMRTDGADIVVLSAGPDGVADSPFVTDGLPTRDDDIVALVSSGGTFTERNNHASAVGRR